MAIDNQFGKGIGVAAGFDLGAQKPLDARIAVNTIAERDAHVENNRAYEGMIVYVSKEKKTYQLVQGNEEGQLVWQELTKEEKDRLDALEAMLNGDEGAEGGALGALQDSIDKVNDRLEEGGDIAEKISQNEADIDALDEKIGVKAKYDDNGTQISPATGVHIYIDAQDAQLKNEIDAVTLGYQGAASGALAEAKKYADEKDLADRTAQAEKDSAQDNKILALEQKFQGVNSVDNKIAAVQDDLDTFKQSQETAHQNLVQKDGELDQAIKDEAKKAREEEGKLQEAIDAINHAENGILAQAKALDKEDRNAQLLVDQAQDNRIKALEDANKEGGAVAEAIAEAKDAADAAQADVDAVEKRLDDEGGLVDRIEANEAFVAAQPAIDAEQDNRLKALEDANKDGGAVKKAIDQVTQDLADFEAEQAIKEKAQDDEDVRLDQAIKNEAARADAAEKANAKAISDEAAAARAAEQALQKAISDEADRAKGEEARIEGLVTAEASRADAEEKRIVGLVEAEAQAARAAEKANADEMTKQKDANQEGTLANKIAANAAAIAQEVTDRAAAVSGEATARANADTALDNRLKAVEASIGDGGDLEKRVEANEDAIKVINGEGKGSIKKAIADLVNGAPEALNTLDELAAALRDNADVLDAIEEAFDNKLSSQKTALQKEIDDDVKVVADELSKQKDASQAGTLAKQIADEAARAAGQEAAIRQELANEKAVLQAEIDADIAAESALRVAEEQRIEKALEDEAAAIRGEMAEQHQAMNEASEQAHQAINKAMEDEAAKVNKKIADDIAAESALRVAEEQRIAGLVNAEAQRADTEEKRIVGLVEAEKGRAEGKEGELLAAINKEIEDRGTAVNAEKSRAEGEEAAIREEFAAADTALNEALKAWVTANFISFADYPEDGSDDLPNLSPENLI